jgi:hypothetical protein
MCPARERGRKVETVDPTHSLGITGKSRSDNQVGSNVEMQISLFDLFAT